MTASHQVGDKEFVIGSISGTTITPETLTNSYTGTGAVVSSAIYVKSIYTIALDVFYTMGASESDNSIQFILETSMDGTNWTRMVNETVSGGTSTLTEREFTFAGTGEIHVPINNVTAEYLRISCKETGVAANYGTVAVSIAKFQEW